MADTVKIEQPNAVENEPALFYPACLYDLRGTSADACPECGEALVRGKLAASAIPWVHREGLAFELPEAHGRRRCRFGCLVHGGIVPADVKKSC